LDDPVLAGDVRLHITGGELNNRHRGLPYPGTFIVDRQGRVTSRFFEDFFRERNTVSNILLKLGTGGAAIPGSRISTDHLEIKTFPSDATVALGNRFSLVLEIAPRPRMHVYAPGASNYRVIALTISAQPFVRVSPIRYPPSEIYFFKPLNERVPVYQKPFTLTQEIIPEVTAEAEAAFRGKDSLRLMGTLEYQACDDKVCYNPASVPLSWTVALKPLERPGRQQ
jgi:Thiol:disulfide interchange protein DsbD, N-terminal